MLIGQGIHLIGNPLLVSLCFWGLILSHGPLRSKPWFPGPPLKLSIMHWPLKLLSFLGSKHYFVSFIYFFIIFQFFDVTMSLALLLLPIQCFMPVPSTSRWTIILFEKRFFAAVFVFDSYLARKILLMCLLKLWLLLSFFCLETNS